MTDRTVQLVLHYDGARFQGWQRQPTARTVQGELEQVFERLLGTHTQVTGAGRTDSGVHARGQAAHVRVPGRWSADSLRRAVNALLPDDVWVSAAYLMTDDFHARYSAQARTYRYYVGTDADAASPFRSRYEWRVNHPLDEQMLHHAAALILGEHIFKGFAVQGTAPEHDSHRCHVFRAEWQPRRGDIYNDFQGHRERTGYVFAIQANRFLHHMVRFLVGTMVDVALNRRTLDSMADLLCAADNRSVSPPAPAHALFLDQVAYPPIFYQSPDPPTHSAKPSLHLIT